MTKKLILILSLLLVFYGINNWTFLHARLITKEVCAFGEKIKFGNVQELKTFFTTDGKLYYRSQELSCEDAFINLKKKIDQRKFTGLIYVGNHQKVSKSYAIVSLAGGFDIEGYNYEASGIAELKNEGLFNWKIAKLSSDNPAFGYAFFNTSVPPRE